MPLKALKKCFTATSTKKTHFLPKNGQKMAIQRPNHFPSVWVVSCCPAYPFLRVLASQKYVQRAHDAIFEYFRVATTKKTPFFAQTLPKNANSGPKQCFLGPGGQFVPAILSFEGAEVTKQICCRLLDPFN